MRHPTTTDKYYDWLYEIIILCVALVCINWDQKSDQKKQITPSGILLPWILPVQKLSTHSAQSINEFWQNRFQVQSIVHEYQSLQKENTELRLQLSQLQNIQAENTRLRNLLAFQMKRKDLQLCYAQVIQQKLRKNDQHLESLRLFVNQQQTAQKELISKIKVGAVVVTQGVMIGFVQKIKLPYLFVLPIDHPTMKLDIVLDKSRLRGIATGMIDQAHTNYQMSLGYLEKTRAAILGERAISTGLDGTFPPGLVIGEVVHQDMPTNGIFQKAYLKTPIQYHSITEVAVVLNWNHAEIAKDPSKKIK